MDAAKLWLFLWNAYANHLWNAYAAMQTIYKCAIATIHQPITFKADEEKIAAVVLWQNLVILNASMHLVF